MYGSRILYEILLEPASTWRHTLVSSLRVKQVRQVNGLGGRQTGSLT